VSLSTVPEAPSVLAHTITTNTSKPRVTFYEQGTKRCHLGQWKMLVARSRQTYFGGTEYFIFFFLSHQVF